MRMWSLNRPMVICAALAMAASTSSAAVLSYQGIFNNDSQTAIFSFVAGSTGVFIQTTSYAGGFNASGQLVRRGGFDPLISLFGPSPVIGPFTPLIGSNDDGFGAAIDPFTGAAFDSILDTTADSIVLIPGQTYFVILSQSGNFPNSNLYRDGFSGVDTSLFGCSNGQFCDVTADNRDGHWAIDIIGAVQSSNTSFPLPLAPSPFNPGPSINFNNIITNNLLAPSLFSTFGSAGPSGDDSSGDPSSGDPQAGDPPTGDPLFDTSNIQFDSSSDCTLTDTCGTTGNPPGTNSEVLSAPDLTSAAVANPEPASVVLFGVAIALGLLARRRLLTQGR